MREGAHHEATSRQAASQQAERKPRSWRIGELARAAGLTVRTLRHFEGAGLLPRPSRTSGRQRVYQERDVQRLYRICALRDLGLSLEEIGRVLARGRMPLSTLLRAHRARVEAEIERLRGVQLLLAAACARAEEEVDAEAVLATIEAMSRVARHGRARGAAPSRRDPEAHWRELGEQLRVCRARGEPASAPRPRALARQAHGYLIEFTGGDPALLQALAHLRRFAPPGDLAGWDQPLMRYLDAALASLEETQHVEGTDRPKRRTGEAAAGVGRARRPAAPDLAADHGARQSARALAAGVRAGAGRARAPRRAL